jgi:hypothetical protein
MTKRPLWLLAALPLLISCAADEGYTPLSGGDEYGSGKSDAVSSESPDRLVDVPYYFAMPKSAISVELNRPEYPQPTLWNPTPSTDDLGLRIIAVEQGETLESRRRARRDMADTLAPAGVLQTGDIILSFRPELAGTMAYPHIQMGTTHAGLVVVDENGEAFNIDSPLDFEYNGKFDAKHYAGEIDENGDVGGGTHALHVLRPRIMDEARRASLAQWAGTLKSGLSRINGERAQIKFQKDYLMPAYVAHGATPRQMVTTLGKIILEADIDTQLPMYCSEFAWHMLALSNCSSDEILNAPDEGADCVDAPFEPMPLVAQEEGEIGIAEGPLQAIEALGPEVRLERIGPVFQDGNADGLSSGHRAVAESVAPLMAPLEQYYQGRLSGASITDLSGAAEALGASFARNYSPTAYFIAAMGDEATRTVDYVVTLAFVNSEGFSKARDLAQRPVP